MACIYVSVWGFIIAYILFIEPKDKNNNSKQKNIMKKSQALKFMLRKILIILLMSSKNELLTQSHLHEAVKSIERKTFIISVFYAEIQSLFIGKNYFYWHIFFFFFFIIECMTYGSSCSFLFCCSFYLLARFNFASTRKKVTRITFFILTSVCKRYFSNFIVWTVR